MVRGAVVTVTPVSGTYQCAEIDRIALGRLVLLADPPPGAVYVLLRKAFIGLPWPKKIAGIGSTMVFSFLQVSRERSRRDPSTRHSIAQVPARPNSRMP